MTHPQSLFPDVVVAQASTVLEMCRERGWRVATAESCTGGLVAALLTELAGSSTVVERGFVTYSNEAKTDLLGVPWPMLEANGAVSRPVAEAMASGALARSRADITVAITGIAGPGGGSPDKPVGLVYFGLARKGAPVVCRERRFGAIGRLAVRLASVSEALSLIEDAARERLAT